MEYSYLNFNNDRRQNNIPVVVDKRCNNDRRGASNIARILRGYIGSKGRVGKLLDLCDSLQDSKNSSFAGQSDTFQYSSNYPISSELHSDILQIKNTLNPFFNKLDGKEDKKENKKKGLVLCAASSIPFFRSIGGITLAVQGHDYFKAIGKTFAQLINAKEDAKDIKSAVDQLIHPEKYSEYREFQLPFAFIKRTIADTEKTKELVDKYDITFFDTKMGQNILKKLGMKDIASFIKQNNTDKLGRPLESLAIEGALLPRVIGRTLMRIPVLGVIFLSLLEIPSILKSLNKKNKIKSISKQMIKSSVNVTSLVLGGALLGAIGAYAGPIGSLVGLGIGSYLGTKVSDYINNQIL